MYLKGSLIRCEDAKVDSLHVLEMDLPVSSAIWGRPRDFGCACRASPKSSNSKLVASLFATALVRVRRCFTHLLGASVIRAAEVRRNSVRCCDFWLLDSLHGRTRVQRLSPSSSIAGGGALRLRSRYRTGGHARFDRGLCHGAPST